MRNLKDTCNYGECYFGQLLDSLDHCPFFQKFGWQGENGVYETKDCSPRRNAFMVQELFNRLIGVQKASEQERNAVHALVSEMSNIIAIIQKNPEASIQIVVNNRPLLENGDV